MSDKDRLDKVLAVAINPGAYEPEAVAALRKARQLVKRDPALAFNLPSMVIRYRVSIPPMRRLLKLRSVGFRSFGYLLC
jgi:hypothetical protein